VDASLEVAVAIEPLLSKFLREFVGAVLVGTVASEYPEVDIALAVSLSTLEDVSTTAGNHYFPV